MTDTIDMITVMTASPEVSNNGQYSTQSCCKTATPQDCTLLTCHTVQSYWKLRQEVTPKHWCPCNKQHSVTILKTVILLVTENLKPFNSATCCITLALLHFMQVLLCKFTTIKLCYPDRGFLWWYIAFSIAGFREFGNHPKNLSPD
jgi:hypothetical protein